MAFHPPVLPVSQAIESVVVPVPGLLNIGITFLPGIFTSCCGPWEMLHSILGQLAPEPASRDVPAFAHHATAEQRTKQKPARVGARIQAAFGA